MKHSEYAESHIHAPSSISCDHQAMMERGKEVIRLEAEALVLFGQMVDNSFAEACKIILAAKQRVIVTGMGKSGHVGRKIAATFAATGTPALYLHPGEAAHGDLGMLVEGDVLMVLSNSGNTMELRSVVDYARRLGNKIIGVAARRTSYVIDRADVAILLPKVPEACAANVAPTTSTTLQLALGDALAMAVMDQRGVTEARLHSLHPGGNIGMRLAPIVDIMHGPDELPLVKGNALMPEVLTVMTSGRFGVAGVVDDAGNLIGIVTDGDLRRKFDRIGTASAAELMTHSPKSIPSDMIAADALLFLNDAEITVAFIIDGKADIQSPPLGIVHIHDLLRFGLN